MRADVVVAGSGAAGLTAALAAAQAGADVLLVERGDAFGGTTALSGGRVWLPADSSAAAEYLHAVCPSAPDSHVEAFVAIAADLPAWVERSTPHRFVVCPRYPDYHPTLPGASLGGRTLDSAPLSLEVLGDEAAHVLSGPASVPVTHAEWERWRFVHRYDWDLLARRDEEGTVTGGRALVAGLLAGCLEAGARVRRSARLTGVEAGEGGVMAARVGDGAIACRAVVLATGGFEWDEALRTQHLRAPLAAFGAPPTNTGDAVRLAVDAGAALEGMDAAWMMPMVQIPGEMLLGEPFFRSLVTERGIPRSILVDATGRRFVDEALPYNELVRGFADSRAWLVFDEGFRRRYSMLAIRPGEPLPEWVTSAPSSEALAGRLGLDAAGLGATVAEWNASCAAGRDERFARGETPYESYYGDPEQPGNPTLGPLDEPPFHAFPVLAGTIGTKGGPRTDADGRALRADGRAVDGLYAVGNAAAGWLADAYPAPGATLGVGMVFGYRAGRHAAAAAQPVSTERSASKRG